MRSRLLRADAGFTLVELLVYSALLTMVLSVVAGLMISALTTHTTVRTAFDAATDAQLAADSIESGVRNSTAFALSAPNGTDQLLRVRVPRGATGSITWVCAAWYYSASGDALRYRESTGAIAAPTPTALANWTLLASEVQPVSGSTVFTATGDRLTLAFTADAGTSSPAQASSIAVRRANDWVSAPCF